MSDKPQKPDESECCGSGCKPCIFDVYEENLKKWEAKRGNVIDSKALNQIRYLPFVITQVEGITDLLKVFTFQSVSLKSETQNGVLIKKTEPGVDYQLFEEFLNIKAGEYLIMKGSFEMNTISRSYTPILNKEDFECGRFTVVVSLTTKGKMSQFFTQLNPNDIVFWRGPYQEFSYIPNSYTNILLIGGGTGVVPLYNISKSIVENDKDDTLVNAICSFKSIETIILRREFGRLRDFWNFKCSFYVTGQSKCDFKLNYNEMIEFKRIDGSVIEEEVKKCGNGVYVVVCGPGGFNQFVKEVLLKLGVKDENIFIFWY